jgi:hypothetical protein
MRQAQPEVGLQHLPDVHARGHAQRIEHDVHRLAVGQEGHVLIGHHAGDDALVAVAAGHLVTHAELLLAGHVDLDLLDDAGVDVVAASTRSSARSFSMSRSWNLPLNSLMMPLDLDLDGAGIDLDVVVGRGQLAQQGLGDLAVGRDDDLARVHVDHVQRDLLAQQDVAQGLGQVLLQPVVLVLELVVDLLDLALALGRGQLGLVEASLRAETFTSMTMP